MGQSVGEQRVFGCWDLLGAGKVIDRFYGAGPKSSSGDEACCRIWLKRESGLAKGGEVDHAGCHAADALGMIPFLRSYKPPFAPPGAAHETRKTCPALDSILDKRLRRCYIDSIEFASPVKRNVFMER